MWIYLAIIFAAPRHGRFLCRYFCVHLDAGFIGRRLTLVHHICIEENALLSESIYTCRCLILNKSFSCLRSPRAIDPKEAIGIQKNSTGNKLIAVLLAKHWTIPTRPGGDINEDIVIFNILSHYQSSLQKSSLQIWFPFTYRSLFYMRISSYPATPVANICIYKQNWYLDSS